MPRGKKTPQLLDGQMTIWDFCTDASKFVVQANRLIGGKQALKLNSAKLIRAAIMQVQPNDDKLKPYIIKIHDFADLLNIDPSNIYKYAEEITDDIIHNPVYVREENGGKTTRFIKIPWVQYCEYNADVGIALQLNEKLKPFLIGLKEHYTQYTLDSVLSMGSVYAIRIFEMLQSKMMLRIPPKDGLHIKMTIAEIRECCDCIDKYERISNFKKHVLDMARDEINRTTVWYVDYKGIKTGREITEVEFFVNANYHSIDTFRIPESYTKKQKRKAEE